MSIIARVQLNHFILKFFHVQYFSNELKVVMDLTRWYIEAKTVGEPLGISLLPA